MPDLYKSWLCHSLAGSPQLGDLPSPSLSFLISRMGLLLRTKLRYVPREHSQDVDCCHCHQHEIWKLPRGYRSPGGPAGHRVADPAKGKGSQDTQSINRPPAKAEEGAGWRRARERAGVTATPWACSGPRVSCRPCRFPGHLCQPGL